MRASTAAFVALLGAIAPVRSAGAQTLADRIGAGTRTVAFAAASRPEVCGNGKSFVSDGLRIGTRIYEGDFTDTDLATMACVHGPVRVVVRVVDGRATRLRLFAGPLQPLGDTIQDLGVVRAADAGAYLREVARNGDGRAAKEALLPIVLVDSLPRWEILAAAARDSTRLPDYRRRASDLLARGAANSLAAPPSDDDPSVAQRRATVRALANRRSPDDDVIPSLIAIARENKHVDVRAEALLQLGRTADRRAIALFETLLAGQ